MSFVARVGGVDLAKVEVGSVLAACVLPLPFRLQVGPLLFLEVGREFSILLRNREVTPEVIRQTMHNGAVGTNQQRWSGPFFTEALIVDHKPDIDEQTAADLVAFCRDSTRMIPEPKLRYNETLKAINDLIVGYYSATSSIFGGYRIEELDFDKLLLNLRLSGFILAPHDSTLPQAELVEILDVRPAGGVVLSQGSSLPGVPGGGFAFYPDAGPTTEQIADIPKYVKLHQEYIFYEFAHRATIRMLQTDYITALLFAVVALEGAHAVLLTRCIERGLTNIEEDAERWTQANKIVETLLIKTGFSAMLSITPTYLDSADKPAKTDMQAAEKAIEVRNSIMHAARKKGSYKLRSTSTHEIAKACSAALAIYRHFVALIEREPRTTTAE